MTTHLVRRRRRCDPAHQCRLVAPPIPRAPLGARSRCATWPRSRTAGSPPRPWSTSPTWSGYPGRGARHRLVLRHAPHRAGRHLRGGRLHQHRLPAGRGRRAPRARRALAGHRLRAAPRPTARSPWRRPSASPTATGRRASRSTTATSGAQTPESFDRSDRRPPLGRPRTPRSPARHPDPGPAHHGPRGRPGRRGRGAARRGRGPGRPRGRRRRGRCLMAITEPPKIVTSRLGLRRLPHPRALPGDRRLRGAAQGAGDDARGRGGRGRRGQPARARRRRLPGRPQVVDAAQEPGDLPRRQRRRVASRRPSRTTCSSSGIPTSWSRGS